MAEDVRSRVTAEGKEARGASLFGSLKACYYDMYTEIRFNFNIWQESYPMSILESGKTCRVLAKLPFLALE
jgi:hypothetical protein